MRSGDIDSAPIWDDVTTLRGDMLPRIDIISGGFPCQDISVAGLGKGLAGERSGLFFEIARLVRECQPRFVFLENVPAIRTRGGERVVKELASIGYDCRWTTLSAAAVGAPHKRERWFLLAHAYGDSIRKKQEPERKQGKTVFGYDGSKEFMAYSMCEGLQRPNEPRKSQGSISKKRITKFSDYHYSKEWWSVEPNVGRVVNGLPNRAHRIKCLGNSVVPLQVREAFKKLAGIN
jgi:DNA (cytosine-5)-methyltransferase 1